ncbi:MULTISPECIES: methylated-DNA--[protein]-cysteine S-methyltransferase [unclassified Amycolatopsis]|uniref:methylated-DNA--[protein]-cysteine S-methyltransferase n=1 Tax=unclassified Amycolatopsis TaxID=2618356 RepID=UPI001FF46714|nr:MULTISPECIES: methylated-DNA--[protein]-cysteine S-methyltransferase [unclassified Amycolatopsis]UOZ05762.1 methylated-DNA--[protein]-cysteine S-methyltransferase [Amycolatopsis sp. WQ 127309]WSJ81360.1 methylated-DNA--[protein]-cysteine S-methyltransferase [Amycolatopsis sp. NBC_01307]WSK75265.1 methylated-DNA--[protein]-cysteine S-methyltransferase [Amycolatopsis sp. NBC_01286]
MSVRHTVIDSPIGPLTLVGDAAGALLGLYFDGHLRTPRMTDLGERTETGFEVVEAQLGEYFAGTRREFDLELAPRGSAFEKQVWDLLTKIPFGETRTYGQLAAALGDPGAAQAVGNANGWNPISVIVPCHRVVGTSGSLTGYAGGLARKRFLLSLEEPPADEVGRLF